MEDLLKKIIKIFLDRKKKAEEEAARYKKAVEFFQGICEHPETESIGNNHNDKITECTICKKRFYEL